MFELPTSIIIEDEEYPIREKGDYRVILDCFSVLQDIELEEKERIIICLSIFYEDALSLDEEGNVDISAVYDLFNTEEKLNKAVSEMMNFFSCGDSRPGARHNYKLIDWEQDNHLIASAINNVARTEIRSLDYLHWWTFMGYYISVGESTLSTVVRIRDKIVKGKKLEKYEREFRQDNPQYFIWNKNTAEQNEIEELGRQLWNADNK